MNRVSIIIPTFNEESVIVDCLESFSKQTYKNLEIIVVDDGSTDSTLQKLDKVGKMKSQVTLVHQQHKGPGSARNKGVKKSTGQILVFVDADMTFDKDFITKLVDPIVKNKTKGTFSKDEIVSNWNNIWARMWNINEGWEDKKRHPINYPNKQKVFRAILKSEFEKVGGFDLGGEYNDDWSLSEKLGYKATVAKGAKFYHQNPETLSEVLKQAKWIAKREYKLGKIGVFVALIRASFPVSLVVGLVVAILKAEPAFLVFKTVFDFGIFIGILEYLIFKRGYK